MSSVFDRLATALRSSYRLERELGAGGMATVFLAHDLKHARDVAIKELHPDLGAALGGERFLSEIRTTARLQHPHILPLLDSGEADGLLYYVMPLVTGETLRARLERERQLPIADAIRIAREVASALDYAHRQNVIHRDIKPENILLQDGSAVVADFGIALAVQSAGGARMTQTGLSLGTPQYMSPEQAMGERTIDARSDLYALGAVTYEMLTGDPPFTGSSVQAVVAKVISAEPERPSLTRKAVTPSLEAAVLRSLEKLPADRYASAAEFSTALTQESNTGTVTTRAKAAPRASRRPMVAMALLAMIPAAIAGWFARGTSVVPTAAIVRPVRLTHAGSSGCASVAPGGQQFALITGSYSDETVCQGALVVRALPTGADRVVVPSMTDVWAIEWSPSGDALLVAGRPEGKPDGAWIYPTKAGTPRQLWTGATTAVGFADSAHIFVVTSGGSSSGAAVGQMMRILDAQSGQQVDSSRIPALIGRSSGLRSPSGKWMVLTADGATARLVLVARDGRVTDSVKAGRAQTFAWIGDTAIVFQGQTGQRTYDMRLQRVNPSTGHFEGSPSVLIAALPPVLSLSYDAASGTLLWATAAITDELHRFPLNSTSGAAMLVRSRNAYLGDPKLSPDGRRVAYLREDALGANVYAIDLATGTEQAISSDTVSAFELFWPTPQHVVQSGLDGKLHSFDLATGRSRAYLAPVGERLAGARMNTWVFSRDATAELIIRDSMLQHAVKVPPPSPNLVPNSGELSPDGRSLGLSWTDSTGRVVYAVYSVPTSSWSAVSRVDAPTWRLRATSDDGTVYFARFTDQTELWRAKAGAQMTRVPLQASHCYIGSIIVSPNGDQLLCNVTANFPDVYMAKLTGAARK